MIRGEEDEGCSIKEIHCLRAPVAVVVWHATQRATFAQPGLARARGRRESAVVRDAERQPGRACACCQRAPRPGRSERAGERRKPGARSRRVKDDEGVDRAEEAADTLIERPEGARRCASERFESRDGRERIER